MARIYTILNKVQISKKPATFALDFEDAPIAENILADLNLRYDSMNPITLPSITLWIFPTSMLVRISFTIW